LYLYKAFTGKFSLFMSLLLLFSQCQNQANINIKQHDSCLYVNIHGSINICLLQYIILFKVESLYPAVQLDVLDLLAYLSLMRVSQLTPLSPVDE